MGKYSDKAREHRFTERNLRRFIEYELKGKFPDKDIQKFLKKVEKAFREDSND